MKSLLATSQDPTLALMRLFLAIIFFAHGSQKALGWFHGYGFQGTMHFFTAMLHIPPFFAVLAILAEFVGSILLFFGLFARIAALAILVNMFVAIFKVHLPHGFFMNWSGAQTGEGYEFHLLAIALAFLILIKGAGGFSIDGAISKS